MVMVRMMKAKRSHINYIKKLLSPIGEAVEIIFGGQ